MNTQGEDVQTASTRHGLVVINHTKKADPDRDSDFVDVINTLCDILR